MSSATVPALLGVAAAAALTLQMGSASASTTAHVAHAATTAKVSHQSGVVHAQLTADVSSASSSTSSYTVESGDTLSSIAARELGSSGEWTAIYNANTGTISNANLIMPGEVLTIPGSGSSQASTTESTSAASTEETSASSSTTSTSASASASTYSGTTAFQECVISRESGGDSQVMNSSGHYGLYQFSASTWAAYGGNAADFGHASVAEQNQVFDTAIADGGESNWAPYDGC